MHPEQCVHDRDVHAIGLHTDAASHGHRVLGWIGLYDRRM
jgi:hypothetical protein